ncbi:hypothetical protein [Mycolicibacterium sp.]|uniref:hypothetical protein n=1 Tax=Mycolicibacterium sp. TaxID=2320850 RepID=UPI0025DA2D74|nr:hypothetical protein [Mycolicibacterium sp.]MCB9410891.1 hypothetical protein [Mycolicibacterium sp.]
MVVNASEPSRAACTIAAQMFSAAQLALSLAGTDEHQQKANAAIAAHAANRLIDRRRRPQVVGPVGQLAYGSSADSADCYPARRNATVRGRR